MPTVKTLWKPLAALLALAAAALPAQSQVASLVRDIVPDNAFQESYASPLRLVPTGGRLVFLAETARGGNELWTSDGTARGTKSLVEASGQHVGTTRNLSFWVLSTPFEPLELWRTDGTRAGTFPLLDLPFTGSVDEPWTVRGDVLFFPRCGESGCGLWRTDGTLAGTREILHGLVHHVLLVGNRVFTVVGEELWRFDPGSETPVLVTRMGRVDVAAALQDRLLMIAPGSDGDELWISDGTAAGTVALTQFANRDPFGHEETVVSTGRRLYFLADDIEHGWEIWVSDGTRQGTRRITDFGNYFPFNRQHVIATLQEVGNRVVFAATDGLSDDPLLWSTDGRPESTTKLMDPCQLACRPFDLFDDRVPFRTARAGNVVVFPAGDERHGLELWATDGTPAGTRLLRDLCPGACSSFNAFVRTAPADAVYFTAQLHLWRTDGTAAGTRRLTTEPVDPVPLFDTGIAVAGGKTFLKRFGDSNGFLALLENGETHPLTFNSGFGSSSDPQSLFAQGDRLHFLLEDGSEHGLWQSAGSAETTRLTSADVSSLENTVSAGGIVYFFNSRGLWRVTDGGIQHIATITDDHHHGSRTGRALGSHLYFDRYRNGVSEIWKTDGTPSGTTFVLRLPSGLTTSYVDRSAERLYLGVYDTVAERARLWVSDGTAAGTREILALPGFFEYVDEPIISVGGIDYFIVRTGFERISRLWRTDGTAAGTREIPLESPSPDGLVRIGREMIAHQGSLYFLAEDYDYPFGIPVLWRVDGETPVRLRSFVEDQDAERVEIASAGGLVFFNVEDGEHGRELWATDGTPEGTRLVRDIAPGRVSARVSGLTSAGGRVFFTARDDLHGVELWESDGTAAGTRIVHDIAPGPVSSNPQWLTAADGRLYFTADDGLTGRELWTLPFADAGCQPSARVLCLQGGRFRVEASWRDFARNTGTGAAVPLTGDTGYFWFFDPANAEVILKVLDGRGVNDHFWVFYGALSTVEYTLTVTDTATGLTLRYINPMGQLASVGDTTGFGPAGAFSRKEALAAPPSPPALVRGWTSKAAATGTCTPGPMRLCLNGGRFAVEASWKDFAGKTGKGTAVPLSNETGYFWFFDAANVEVLLKVLDGTPLNGKFWVFYGALSNVEYTLTVTDTQTGEIREYRNPSGRFASVADTEAF